jgi:hypothetical protein
MMNLFLVVSSSQSQKSKRNQNPLSGKSFKKRIVPKQNSYWQKFPKFIRKKVFNQNIPKVKDLFF